MTDRMLLLPEIMDLNAARPLLTALLERGDASLLLDGSAVRRIGGLCLQILLSAHRTCVAAKRAFELDNPSLELREALALFGARSLL
jgi:chemotaxis protein CheX